MPKQYEKYDVFLSFSSFDHHIARELKAKFEAAGLKSFLSAKDISAGERWQPAIRDAMRRSDRILLLITPRSKNSMWVTLETGAAWMQEKELIPLTQFVEPGELGDIAKDFQIRVIETESQKAALVEELREPRGDSPLSFRVMLASIRSAVDEMNWARRYPEVVVGSGRDGAVCAAIFAEILGRKSVRVIDCHFAWKGKNRRTQIDADSVNKKDVEGKNILVVEWARQTGKTYELIEKRLQTLKPAALYSYALFWTQKVDRPPDYYSFEHPSVPIPPWGQFRPWQPG
jgi:hypoxanthine phosphoribosyltransferase